jgi:AcrR family transcriptional regulator
MTTRNPTKPAARAPQRSNGVKRREAILKAAADIISDVGIAGLTLHAAAKRAKSSIGSMYHFFSDKDQLLTALRDQHREDMDELMSHVSAISVDDWVQMTADDVVDTVFGRPIQYYLDHPFALELHQLHEGQSIDEFMALLEKVMVARMGKEHGTQTAKVLYAVSTGTLSFVLDVENARQRSLASDIPAVLKAYLAGQEAMIR